jgi:hypothetical protein
LDAVMVSGMSASVRALTLQVPPLTFAMPVLELESIPVPPRAAGSVPLVILLVSREGMSAATRERKPGVPALPLGAASTVFADSLVQLAVRVPLPVTGLPLTENPVGMLSPTLVTVPLPTLTHCTVGELVVVTFCATVPAAHVAVPVPALPFARSYADLTLFGVAAVVVLVLLVLSVS